MTAASPAIVGVSVPGRLAAVLREIVRGGLAGLLAGIIVAGIGGRLVMRIAALLNPGATGSQTGAGEVVGTISLGGTLALIVFSGIGFGLIAGVVWVVIAPWLPGAGRRRLLLAALATVALGGMFLIEASNRDFTILGPDSIILAMLIGLVAVMGAAVAWFDERLDRRLPRPGPDPAGQLVGYGLPAVIGALLIPAVLSQYVGERPCLCAYPPELTGWALIGVALVTLAWWLQRIATGRLDRPFGLVVAGRVLLVMAVAFGTVALAGQVAEIIAAG